MFRILNHNTPIVWPVKVSVPVDGGDAKVFEFNAHFRLLPLSEATEQSADQEFLARVLVGWDGVQDEAGNALEFSDEARTKLCDISYAKAGILAAYFECSAGSARKNSKTRRGTG